MTLGTEDITQWSITALNNGNSDNAINWVEHQPRASVNNSARSVMAAIAKNRDMQNGSIVTGGSANAQTALTAVNFGGAAIPAGTRLRVKVGPGLTTTASGLTLSVDTGAPSGVLNMLGQSPGPGEWMSGAFVDIVFDGTYWNMATSLPGVFTPTNLNHGRLVWQSATALAFVPYGGNQIKVNGVNYQIPSSGIVFSNVGVNVGGVVGNLGANTTYLVGVNVVAGVLTPYYTTTLTHAASGTLGNVGTEIVGTNDAISVVGMIRTNASAQFQDDQSNRLVRSWFNKPATSFYRTLSTATNNSGGFPQELSSALRSNFVLWAGETVNGGGNPFAYGAGAVTQTFAAAPGFDGAADANFLVQAQQSQFYGADQPFMNVAFSFAEIGLAEGFHFLSLYVGSSGGNNQVWTPPSAVWGNINR